MEQLKEYARYIEYHHDFFALLFAVIAGWWALKLLRRNSRLQRISNLQSLWRAFYNDKEFMELFNNLDAYDNNQSDANNNLLVDQKIKLRFLAFLSEVYYFAEVSGIEKEKTLRLFQWHFYYTFINEKTKVIFWSNLVTPSSTDQLKDTIETEIQKSYWKKYYLFAKEAEQKMKSEGSI